jgi:hypothetical protein
MSMAIAWSSSPFSIVSRRRAEISGWVETIGRLRNCCSVAIWLVVKLETPKLRILPALCAASTAAAISAGWVRMSGR